MVCPSCEMSSVAAEICLSNWCCQSSRNHYSNSFS